MRMLLVMIHKEISRIDIIRDVYDRHLRKKDAAGLLSLTRRHIQRLVNAYRTEGPVGLVSFSVESRSIVGTQAILNRR